METQKAHNAHTCKPGEGLCRRPLPARPIPHQSFAPRSPRRALPPPRDSPTRARPRARGGRQRRRAPPAVPERRARPGPLPPGLPGYAGSGGHSAVRELPPARSLGAGKPLPLGVEPESPRPHSGERHQNCARGAHFGARFGGPLSDKSTRSGLESGARMCMMCTRQAAEQADGNQLMRSLVSSWRRLPGPATAAVALVCPYAVSSAARAQSCPTKHSGKAARCARHARTAMLPLPDCVSRSATQQRRMPAPAHSQATQQHKGGGGAQQDTAAKADAQGPHSQVKYRLARREGGPCTRRLGHCAAPRLVALRRAGRQHGAVVGLRGRAAAPRERVREHAQRQR
jgi:hypothetical protein